MDAGLQPDAGRDDANQRLPDLFGADHRRPPPGYQLVVDRELALRAGGRQHADDEYLHLDLGQLLLHVPRLRPCAVHLRVLAQQSRRCADGPGAGAVRPAHRQPAQGGQVFPRRCCRAAAADRRRHHHGARLLRSTKLLRHRAARHPAVQLPARRAHPIADRVDRRVVDRRRPVPGTSDRRRARGARTRLPGGPAVLGDTADRRRSIDRQLARHHGLHRRGWFWFGNQGLSYIQLGRFWQIGFFIGLVLWSLLVFRALWPTACHAVAGDAPVLVRPHPAGAPDLGLHHQHRGSSMCSA